MRAVIKLSALAGAGALLAVGCGGSPTSGGGGGGQKATITSLLEVDPNNMPSGWTKPTTLGHVTNYLVHEWYQNETKAEKGEAQRFGIDFSINDANLNLQKSLAALDDYVAKKEQAIVFTPVDEKASGPAIQRAKGHKTGFPAAKIVSVDGKGLKDEAVKVSTDALTANRDINVIFGINDDSALGGLQAYRAAGLPDSKVLVAGFGCEGKACKTNLLA